MQRIATTLLALVLGLGVLLPAWAAVSRDEAAAIAQKKEPGRVLKVERGLHVDNSVVWKVQVLTAGGQVRMVMLDAETGKVR